MGASDLSSRVAAFVGGTGLLIWPYLETIDLFTLVSYCRQPSLWILGSGFEQHLLNHLGTYLRIVMAEPPYGVGAIRAWATSVTKPSTGVYLATQEEIYTYSSHGLVGAATHHTDILSLVITW